MGFQHCQFMMHDGYLGLQGTANQVDDAQKNYKRQNEKVKQYVLDRTEIDEKTFNKNKKNDWYFTTDELVKYKIVDKIIENFEDIYSNILVLKCY